MRQPPNVRTFRVLTIVLLLAFVSGIVWLCLPQEPSYKGKRFSYWLDQLPGTLVSDEGAIATTAPAFASTSQDAKAALDAVGTNGLRTLMSRLRGRDSRIKSAIQHLGVRLGLFKAQYVPTAQMRRAQALTAIIKLDERAAPIVPNLIALTQSDDSEIRLAAAHALRNVARREYRRLEREDRLGKAAR